MRIYLELMAKYPNYSTLFIQKKRWSSPDHHNKLLYTYRKESATKQNTSI